MMVNFVNFMNLESYAHNNALEEIFFQSLEIELKFMGWSIAH
jgi:hypothetical protein